MNKDDSKFQFKKLHSVQSGISTQDTLSQLEKTSKYQQEIIKAAEGDQATPTPGKLKKLKCKLT